MDENKKYYNQKYVINTIHSRTNYPVDDIWQILNALWYVLKEKFSDCDNYVEMKILPGIKISAKYITLEQSKSNLDISDSDFILSLKASFSVPFRTAIRTAHKCVMEQSNRHPGGRTEDYYD